MRALYKRTLHHDLFGLTRCGLVKAYVLLPFRVQCTEHFPDPQNEQVFTVLPQGLEVLFDFEEVSQSAYAWICLLLLLQFGSALLGLLQEVLIPARFFYLWWIDFTLRDW